MPRGGERFDGQRQRQGERRKTGGSGEQAEDRRGERPVAASLPERREREQKKQGLRVHRDQEKRGRIEEEKEESVAAPPLAQPVAPLGSEQEPGGQETDERKNLSRREPVHRHERGNAAGQIRIERKESVGGRLAGSRSGAIASLQDRQVPARVVAREWRSAILDFARPHPAGGKRQRVAGNIGPGQNERRPCHEETGGAEMEPAPMPGAR